jgi:hypothetical protein
MVAGQQRIQEVLGTSRPLRYRETESTQAWSAYGDKQRRHRLSPSGQIGDAGLNQISSWPPHHVDRHPVII